MRSINKGIRDEDCYKGLDAMVKAFTTSLPLVAELRSPTMRTRHWDALMAATKKEIRLEDPTFSLQHLLDLELHKFEEEVGEIVDQAQKEEKMETALSRLGETWAKMEFQFLQHGQTEVYTVKMVEEDFEALEDDQVLLQVRHVSSLWCIRDCWCSGIFTSAWQGSVRYAKHTVHKASAFILSLLILSIHLVTCGQIEGIQVVPWCSMVDLICESML